MVVARRADNFSKSIEVLLDAAIEATPGVALTASNRSGQTLTRKLEFVPAISYWATDVARFGPTELQWVYQDRDDLLDAPAFWIGIFFNDVPGEGHVALGDQGWQRKLPAGLHSVAGDYHYIGRWKYLSELVVSGRTFDEQGQALVVWAEQALDEIKALPVPPARRP